MLDCRTDLRETIPIRIIAYKYKVYIPHEGNRIFGKIIDSLTKILPFFELLRVGDRQGWEVQATSTRMSHPGNIVTLGGVQKKIFNGLYLKPPKSPGRWRQFRWSYLNSNLKNILKVLIGFIPAFLTFALPRTGGCWPI